MRLIGKLLLFLGLISFVGCNNQIHSINESSNTENNNVDNITATEEVPETLYLLEKTPEATLSPTEVWKLEEMEFGKEKIGVIVKALETYKSEFGDYPSSLAKLVPNYLPVMPLSLAGEPFFMLALKI